MVMHESLHSNSPLPPPRILTHNSYIPMTLNSYITPITAGPRGPLAHKDDPQDQGKSQLGCKISCSKTASHSYCQKSIMVTAIIFLAQKKNNRFTHYFPFPQPVTLRQLAATTFWWGGAWPSSSPWLETYENMLWKHTSTSTYPNVPR